MSEVPHKTDALPSKCRRTIATDRDAVDELFKPSEMPRPRFGARGALHAIALAAFVSAVFHSPSAGVSFGLNASPLAGRFRRRISTASMPRVAAASFNCDSTAHEA